MRRTIQYTASNCSSVKQIKISSILCINSSFVMLTILSGFPGFNGRTFVPFCQQEIAGKEETVLKIGLFDIVLKIFVKFW